jgi:hypothetical protein
MKLFLILSIFVLKYIDNLNAQTTYDIFTYTEPKNYVKTTNNDNVSYSKIDTLNNYYIVIGLYKQNVATGDLAKDFDTEWKEIPVASLGVTMQPIKENGKDINGWKSNKGKANFMIEGQPSTTQLIVYQKNKVIVSVLFVSNNAQLLAKEAEGFLSKLKLGNTTQTIPLKTQPTSNANNKIDSVKIDLWTFLSYSSRRSDYYPVGSIIINFYAVYPSGDFNAEYPFYGMGKPYNPKLLQSSVWGKYSVKGNSVHFKTSYGTDIVNKKSATQYEMPNSTFIYYKCPRVDGLKLQGGWTREEKWRDNSYNQGTCRPVIYFGTDGSFIDRGAFLNACGSPSTDPGDQPGEGTYSINNFTLTLNYKDGRFITKAFSGYRDKHPSTYNNIIYIGTHEFYKDK